MPVPVLLASLIPVLISSGLAVLAWWTQDRSFRSLTKEGGPAERERPWVRMGLGLDDFTVGTWDFAPARRALRKPTGNPGLESARRAAGVATILLIVQLPVGLIEASLVSSNLGVPSLVPILVAFMSWAIQQTLAFKPALWFSRPELQEWQSASTQGWMIVFGIVGGTLLLALVAVVVAQALRG